MKRFVIIAAVFVLVTTVAHAQWVIDEDFESGVMPSGWSAIDANDDGAQFNPLERTTHAHSGDWVMFVDCYTNDGDDWLILPQVTPNSNDVFSFFARAWYGTEILEVRLSTSGDSDDDFDVVLDEIIDLTDSYAEFIYDLSEYAGQDCYLAIRWIQDTYGVLIDDVKVGQTDVVPVTESTWGRVKDLYR